MKTVVIDKNYIYRSVFAIWFVMSILKGTTIKFILGIDIEVINSIVDAFVAFSLVAIIWFYQGYTKKELSVIVVVSVLLIISAYRSHNYVLISGWLFIIAAKGIDLDELMKLAYKTLIVMFCIVFFLRFCGVAKDFSLYRYGRIRYSLGFGHPNILGLRVFQLNLTRLYTRRKTIGIKDFIFCVGSVVFIMFIPNSQTALVCTILLTMLMVTNRIFEVYFQKRYMIFPRMLIWASIALNVISIVLSLLDEKKYKLIFFINRKLSLRFFYCHKVLKIFGVSLLGNRLYISGEGTVVREAGVGRLYLDNAYMGIMLWFGIIVYVLFSVSYIMVMRHYYKERDIYMLIVLFCFALYGFMELGTYIISNNIFLIAFSPILFFRSYLPSTRERSVQFSKIQLG